MTPSGTLTTLYSLCSRTNCADGAWPEAGLIQGSDGNFYGTARIGGASSHRRSRGPGAVFKLTPSGAITTIHRFCRKAHCTDGQDPIAALTQGGDGNFYGTTLGGAKPKGVTVGPGTVFRLTPSGTLTTLHTFCSSFDRRIPSCLDGILPDANLIQGSDGNFYGTTLGGGTNDDGTVFELRRRNAR